MNTILRLAFVLLASTLTFISAPARGNRPAQGNAPAADFENTDLFLSTSISQDNVYVGVPVCFSVVLYSTNPSVAFCSTVKEPAFGGIKAMNVGNGYYDRGYSRETVNGRQYFTYTLHTFILEPTSPGTFVLNAGDYIVSVNEYDYVNDPFWGMVRRAVPAEYPVKAKDMKIKVKALPKAPSDFSGAAGEFSLKVDIAKQVSKTDDERFYITVSGQGDLSDAEIPNLIDQLPNALGIKSITSQGVNRWLENGVIRSSLTYECVFSPAEYGSVTIPALSFCYFNTLEKKYRTAKSEPIVLDVVEDALPGRKPVYQDI